MTVSFNKLFECLTDTVPPQFVVEGSLDREEAQRVKLDVIFKDDTDDRSDDDEPVQSFKKAFYTLESALLSLHPSQ